MEFGLIGEHLSHSYSPQIHAQLSSYLYTLCELKPEELEQFMMKRDFRGINVTIPYKQSVIPYLDVIDDHAKSIGSVNTIVNRDGKLYGYNTDYDGFLYQLRQDGIEVTGKKVLVIGNGGASKAVLAVLQDLHAKEVKIVYHKPHPACISYETCYQQHKDAQVIINTTPVGMYPHEDALSLHLDVFCQLEAVVDVIYHPFRTSLLLEALDRGCKISNGLTMLVAQAHKASEYFSNQTIDSSCIQRISKCMMDERRNIILIGMPSCGKTTFAKILKNYLDYEMVDIDQIIEQTQNRSIAQIFEEEGEQSFRDMESEVCRMLSRKSHLLISPGGGVVIRKCNMDALRHDGIVIFLDRKMEYLLTDSSRPLCKSAQAVKKLYDERIELYRRYADYIVDNNGSMEDTLHAILKIMK